MSLCTSLFSSGARAGRRVLVCSVNRTNRSARVVSGRLGRHPVGQNQVGNHRGSGGSPGRITSIRPGPGLGTRAVQTGDGEGRPRESPPRASQAVPITLGTTQAGRRFTTVTQSSSEATASETETDEAALARRHPLFLHNSRSRKKERFVPNDDTDTRKVSMYVCGVTVYDYSHIGHARVYVAFDVLFRQLIKLGYDVTYARNFTDVDDKIIKRATENGETCDALVTRFIAAFSEDMASLGCLPPSMEPKATEHIGDIVGMTERLIEKGHAYETGDGDVYFAVESLASYGALSGRKLEDGRAGGSDRVAAVDARKKHPGDFALWKAAKQGEPTWQSPWGPGRPGWHIECSAMIEKCFGTSIDIHGGGADLTFPHHENELAQSTAACGCGISHDDDDTDASQSDVTKKTQDNFVKYWVHNGFVKVDNEKMSKSLGNFFTIREVTSMYHPLALRWMLLQTHYRAPINYTQRALEEASDRLFYLYQTLRDAAVALGDEAAKTETESNGKPKPPTGVAAEGVALAAATTAAVSDALADDLNTPLATAALSQPLKVLNDLVSTKGGKKAAGRYVALRDLIAVVNDTLARLGLPAGGAHGLPAGGAHGSVGEDQVDEILDSLRALALKRAGLTLTDIDEATAKRTAARAAKDFATSDLIRDDLFKKGIALSDGGADGASWRPCPVDFDRGGEE